MNDALFHNATLYFTFISGLFYPRLAAGRSPSSFYAARVRNVVLPYVVVSIALTLAMAGPDAFTAGELPGLVLQLAENILLGEAFYTFWYIPVIMILYLASPVLLAVVTTPRLAPLAVALALLPLVFSRTDTDLTASTVIYFCGAYVLGLAVGLDPDRWLDRLARWKAPLLAVGLVTTVLIIHLYMTGIRFAGMTDIRESLYYIQKVALGGIILLWLRTGPLGGSFRIEAASVAIASMAFAIYFLHAPVLRKLVSTFHPFGEDATPNWAMALHIPFLFLVSLVICIAVVLGTRRVFGKRYARWLIGA